MIILTHSEPEAHLLHQMSSWRAQRSLLPCGSLRWCSAPGHRWADRWTDLLSCAAAAILNCTRAAINEQEHKPSQNKTIYFLTFFIIIIESVWMPFWNSFAREVFGQSLHRLKKIKKHVFFCYSNEGMLTFAIPSSTRFCPSDSFDMWGGS